MEPWHSVSRIQQLSRLHPPQRTSWACPKTKTNKFQVPDPVGHGLGHISDTSSVYTHLKGSDLLVNLGAG